MGLLDNTTPQQYYQGTDYGNYQFTSLNDIITQPHQQILNYIQQKNLN